MNTLLAGVRVLDLSRLLPGPFCTQYLAQLGAEIVKVEDPAGGDYARALSPELFALTNRGKQSVTLDLRKATDVETFRDLAAKADVVIESFRPGVMDKLGCGYETLRERNPALVYAALTGYGQTGPYRDRASHDVNFLAYGGVLDQNRAADGTPVMANVQIGDLAGGALTCAVAVLAALFGARASGAGSFVDIGMFDGVLALQAMATSTLRTLGHTLPGGHDMISGGLPNYNVYVCADGKHLALGALEWKFFAAFCAAVGDPKLSAMPIAAGEAGLPLRRALEKLFRTRSRDEWESLLASIDCCAIGVYTLEEALASDQVRERGLWTATDGKPAFRFPAHFSNATTSEGQPPALGGSVAQDLLKTWEEDPGEYIERDG